MKKSHNTGKPMGDKGKKAHGNKKTRQVADRYKRARGGK